MVIPRLAKFVSLGGRVTYFAEMPVSPSERVRVYNMWLDDHSYIEPYVRGHRVFDQYPCSLEEVHQAGLHGWWESDQIAYDDMILHMSEEQIRKVKRQSA